MRPRLLHLGYLDPVGGELLVPAPFNEAEAFTPRIWAVMAPVT